METSNKVVINKSKRNLSREELENLPKDELIIIIGKLEAHNKQLKNILEKKSNPPQTEKKRRRTDRSLDFTKFHRRHVLLKFCYLGWDYDGYVIQENTNETIEFHLFHALHKICLIENRESSNYNRCGRTDKGVSAFEQVVSIDLRSTVSPENQLTQAGINEEINYVLLMNKVLPSHIRAISWRPLITPTYSARFDCIGRTYKYFFPRGVLDVEKMQEACTHLVGSHDFRNLCKMDVGNGVVNYIRRLDNVQIKVATRNHENLTEFDMLYLEIKGSAFLWHMIRCIVAILLLVGQKRESPDITKELLDIEKNSKKPQYSLASEIPLNLFNCNFREEQQDEAEVQVNTEMLNKWIYDEEALREVIEALQEHWCNMSIKSAMMYEMLGVLRQEYSTHYPNQLVINTQMTSLNKDSRMNYHHKLHNRQKCSTLEDRIEHFTKKRRLVKVDEDSTIDDGNE